MRKYIVSGIALFMLLSGLVILTLSFYFEAGHTQLLLINNASERVSRGEIEVCDQRSTFTDLKPGERISFNFKVPRDCHYRVLLNFSSDRQLIRELGYLTHGLVFEDTLIVTDSDLILKSNKPKRM